MAAILTVPQRTGAGRRFRPWRWVVNGGGSAERTRSLPGFCVWCRGGQHLRTAMLVLMYENMRNEPTIWR